MFWVKQMAKGETKSVEWQRTREKEKQRKQTRKNWIGSDAVDLASWGERTRKMHCEKGMRNLLALLLLLLALVRIANWLQHRCRCRLHSSFFFFCLRRFLFSSSLFLVAATTISMFLNHAFRVKTKISRFGFFFRLLFSVPFSLCLSRGRISLCSLHFAQFEFGRRIFLLFFFFFLFCFQLFVVVVDKMKTREFETENKTNWSRHIINCDWDAFCHGVWNLFGRRGSSRLIQHQNRSTASSSFALIHSADEKKSRKYETKKNDE